MEVHFYKNEKNIRSVDLVISAEIGSDHSGNPALTGVYYSPDGRGSEPAIGHDYRQDGVAALVGNNKDMFETYYYRGLMPAARALAASARANSPDGATPSSQEDIDNIRDGAAAIFGMPKQNVRFLQRSPEGELIDVMPSQTREDNQESQPKKDMPEIEL